MVQNMAGISDAALAVGSSEGTAGPNGPRQRQNRCDSEAGEQVAPGQGGCKQGPNCPANGPADSDQQQQRGTRSPSASQVLGSQAGGPAPTDSPAGRMVEQVRGWYQAKAGCQAGLRGGAQAEARSPQATLRDPNHA
ncbi:hypothetical protein MDA_GLEAN10007315 [Myotis davidii]|uniref:Uncharacterized protein n=1 Tax=Myotis davidii TaxID=225400 RepID=L5M9V7_MYODS|nr:hypothetical protein MDA_GLEAN10007315 [Myotis davidii]